MGSIDSSLLTSWYNVQAGVLNGSTSGASSVDTSSAAVALELFGGPAPTISTSSSSSSPASTQATSPTPPWSSTSTSSSSSSASAGSSAALAQSLLNGGKLINPGAAKLSVTSSNNATNENYQNLFALYQGLSALSGLAQQASASGVGALQQSQLETAFQSGMQQVQSFLQSNPFSGFQVFQSNEVTTDNSSAAVPQETDSYTGGVIYSGQANTVIPAFQNAGPFSLTVTNYAGAKTVINFDFSQMGSTPRTMANVLAYMNGKMQAAGVATRFTESVVQGGPQTETVDGQTITLSSTPNQYALKIQGTSAETLSFSAPTTDPAVYVGQTSGITAAQLSASGSSSTSGVSADAVQQLVKFDASATPAATTNANDQVFSQTLGSNVGAVQATATAPDGSVYVLADVTGTTAGQTLQGAQDVALIKYDSAGNVVFTRTLGAATTASGYGLSVSADGSQVAITGSTPDNLNITPGVSGASSTDSASSTAPPQGFVTVFDSSGDEEWTQQISSIGGNGGGVQPNAVAFGANNMVYLAGQTDGTIPGGTGSGNIDAFVVGYQATSVPLNDGSGQSEWVPVQTTVQQYGTSGVDRATGIAVSGSSVYVSSVENGAAVVRQFQQTGTDSTSLTQVASRNLGSLQGGNVAGVAVNSDGSVIVAGSTHNGALNAGTVTQPYAGNEEAFVASLSGNLQPSSSDTLTYLGSTTDQTATALAVSGGQVYLTGQIATTPVSGSGVSTAFDGYVAAVDPQTGQVTWSQRYQGQDNEAAPATIAVSQSGASALDELGLPTGAIDYTPSQLLVSNTSLRPGDEFFIKAGGGPETAVRISAEDTYQTLAAKIEQASGFYATATVSPGTKGDVIDIKPAFPGQQVQIIAGPQGADALGPLGLQEGVISSRAAAETSMAPVNQSRGSLPPATSIKNGYSLVLPSTLNLDSASAIKQAQSALSGALSTVKSIYSDMTTPPASSSSSSSSVPQYLLDQVANYQAALARLTGQ